MNTSQTPYQAPVGGFRTFVILWFTQALSLFGTQLTFFAMTVWLTQTLYPLAAQRSELAGALSAVALVFAVPNIVLAPFAGVLADRYDRRTIMFWSNIGSGLVSLALAGLLVSGQLTLALLLVMQAAFSVFGCLHNSAFDASYAMLVPEKQLPRANGMMQTMASLSGILAPAIAATLITIPGLLRSLQPGGFISQAVAGLKEGAVLAIGIDALTFLAAAAVLPFLTVPSPRHAAQAAGAPAGGRKRSIMEDVKQGLAFIAANPAMLQLLALFAIVNLLATPSGVLLPLIVREKLTAGTSYEAALALISTLGAVGGVAGGIAVTAWGGLRSRRAYGVVVPIIISGLAQAAFGFSPWLLLAGGMIALRNAMMPVLNSHSQTIWQTLTPREMQGRVFAVRRVIAQFTWPLGTAMAGWLGGRFDPARLVSVLGVLTAIAAATQLANVRLMHVDDRRTAVAAAAAGQAVAPATTVD